MSRTERTEPNRIGHALVVAVVVVLLASGLAVPVTASAQRADDVDTYVIEQGDRCEELMPLSTHESIEAFYDYRSHGEEPGTGTYSSHGTAHLQRSDGSILFLHESPDGVSLVVVHDELDGGTDGGSVTFEFAGLPTDGEWIVEDDTYASAADDTFEHGDGWSEMTWIWRDDRTDGAAFTGGLDEPFAITIDPAFNEEANYRWTDNGHDGDIDDWDALSGDADDPREIALDLDERIVIRSGTCADPSTVHERTDGGLAATVTASEPVPTVVQPPGGPTDAVRYDRLLLTPGQERVEVSLEPRAVESETDTLEGVDGGAVLGYLDATVRGQLAGDATFTVRVRPSVLDDHNVSATDVGVYVQGSDGWVLAPTAPVTETGEYVEFEATLPRVDTLAVATQRPSIELADVTLDADRIESGEEVEVTATVRNTGHAPGKYTVEVRAFDEVVDATSVEVPASDEVTVSFVQRFDAPGDHTIGVNGETRAVTVDSTGSSPMDRRSLPTVDDVHSGVGAVVVGLVVLSALLGAIRLR